LHFSLSLFLSHNSKSTAKYIPMVVIRLARGGSHNRPFYNIVVADKRNRRDGRFIERVGYYNPLAAEGVTGLSVTMDRLTHWEKHGAQLSPTVARLVKGYVKKQAGVVA
jgi:small subunit ribosomal protein S16